MPEKWNGRQIRAKWKHKKDYRARPTRDIVPLEPLITESVIHRVAVAGTGVWPESLK
jgi:hypothetical protein